MTNLGKDTEALNYMYDFFLRKGKRDWSQDLQWLVVSSIFLISMIDEEVWMKTGKKH